jgi:hypothetical protein
MLMLEVETWLIIIVARCFVFFWIFRQGCVASSCGGNPIPLQHNPTPTGTLEERTMRQIKEESIPVIHYSRNCHNLPWVSLDAMLCSVILNYSHALGLSSTVGQL